MAPMLTLERPVLATEERVRPDIVGNDGLTAAERDDAALNYLAGPARRRLSDDELAALAARRG